MYEDVKEYFSNEEFQKEMREKGAYKKTREKAHGQIEIREYYQTEDIRWLSQKKNWKGLRSIVMEKKRIETRKCTSPISFSFTISSGRSQEPSLTIVKYFSIKTLFTRSQPSGARSLEYRKYALAFGSNISGGCKYDNR